MMNFWLKGIAVFVVAAIVDMCWAHYTRHLTERNRWRAGFWSVAIAALSAGTMLTYVDDRRFLAFALCGYFVGTVITVGKKPA
jgi:hypothetical protein